MPSLRGGPCLASLALGRASFVVQFFFSNL